MTQVPRISHQLKYSDIWYIIFSRKHCSWTLSFFLKSARCIKSKSAYIECLSTCSTSKICTLILSLTNILYHIQPIFVWKRDWTKSWPKHIIGYDTCSKFIHSHSYMEVLLNITLCVIWYNASCNKQLCYLT